MTTAARGAAIRLRAFDRNQATARVRTVDRARRAMSITGQLLTEEPGPRGMEGPPPPMPTGYEARGQR